MSLKDKILNAISAHPKLVTFGIAFGITFVIGTVIGMVDHEAFARQSISQSNSNHPE
jgi:hypothetical protein